MQWEFLYWMVWSGQTPSHSVQVHDSLLPPHVIEEVLDDPCFAVVDIKVNTDDVGTHYSVYC